LQFFAQDAAQGSSVDWLSALPDVLAERVVDHGLVTTATRIGSFSEQLEHVIVEVDRDARLSGLLDDGTLPRFAKVVFFPHIVVVPFSSHGAPK
jgi:hypothetical protein